MAAADRVNVDAAIYIFQSSGPYTGSYHSSINGVGSGGLLPLGQGFFVRVSSGFTSGALTFRNSQRLTQFSPATSPFQRPAETRPLVQLTLLLSTAITPYPLLRTKRSIVPLAHAATPTSVARRRCHAARATKSEKKSPPASAGSCRGGGFAGVAFAAKAGGSHQSGGGAHAAKLAQATAGSNRCV